MTEHPDFLNVRKLVIVMATAPIALLLFLTLIDLSWHHFNVWQSAGVWCTQTAPNSSSSIKLYGSDCQK